MGINSEGLAILRVELFPLFWGLELIVKMDDAGGLRLCGAIPALIRRVRATISLS